MARVHLVHWHAAEAAERAARLRAAGYEVEHAWADGAAVLRRLREDLPAAVVIDLARQPAHGREVAVALRQIKSIRNLPLVFVGGEAQKVERIRELLPDAAFTTWDAIAPALAAAIARPPAAAVVPPSYMAGYSGRPLVQKLGIKPGSVVGLIGAPADFEDTLGTLPEGATLRRGARGRCDLLVWFVRSQRELAAGLGRLTARQDLRALWIAWPKKTSAFVSDLTEQHVRTTGLAAGLVDYKICAVDETWSGLLFARRRA